MVKVGILPAVIEQAERPKCSTTFCIDLKFVRGDMSMNTMDLDRVLLLKDKTAYSIYSDSIHFVDNVKIFMVNAGEKDYLVSESSELGFMGEVAERADGTNVMLVPLDHGNAAVLRKLFPFTAPSRVLEEKMTMGVGDRLGIACDGHIRVFCDYPQVFPVFAQQSIRELTLTHRTFDDVLDCVSFSVFKNNYTHGFGADGDHLKTLDEVKTALGCGYTMITLDCSQQINDSAAAIPDDEVRSKYSPHPELEELYMNRRFRIGPDVVIDFDEDLFKRTVLIYGKAIDHAVEIFHSALLPERGQIADYEISIDETSTPTLPAQHFFVASELRRRGVHVATIAPRFCGEFQKGIDYVGDIGQFESELRLHAAIARHFGYKLSVHSGSDKFSIFPCVGRETERTFHLKTAGTNWLEAMKLVAIKAPALYRRIHEFALKDFPKAAQYYHVTTDLTSIPDLSSLSDAELPELFRQNDARQLIHITYGAILNARDPNGNFSFRDDLYYLWRAHADAYSDLLYEHIGAHLKALLGEA